MVLVCEACQTPIYTNEYVGVRENLQNSLSHRTRFYHIKCYIRRMEEMKV